MTQIIDALSIDESTHIDFSIYPNPFRDVLTIESQFAEFDVKLFDIFGKQVAQFQNQAQIETSNLASGLYFLNVSSEGLQETFKRVKH
ncbi:T9SS type A sorting domain-containing protein [Psychroserpens jangbogonensis]|uniref:T9SS type A sorting domain-containing protein n=1 Tax=Psychroserpens jangbogonensis TaxID=1484460 RepID=UPI00053E9351|nr:T9SS type A sorting domain-containing protein [Psychroserpens jangbogonensis]